MNDLTTLLDAARQGDGSAINELFAAMYPELHKLAHARLRHSEQITLLDTTSLVHESYLRFLKAGRLEVNDQSHFLAYAARVMRSAIVDLVRRRRADRRGGGEVHVTLNTDIAESVHGSEDEITQVNDALEDLAQVDVRLVRVVEMRYFAGLSEQDIAASLGVTERTVRRDWKKARLLLRVALQ
jgi:RNA polymerase sigma factor (TIGR02999 family)